MKKLNIMKKSNITIAMRKRVGGWGLNVTRLLNHTVNDDVIVKIIRIVHVPRLLNRTFNDDVIVKIIRIVHVPRLLN